MMAATTPSKSRKRKAQSSESPTTKHPKIKKCDRRLCDHTPFCFVQASEKCAKNGYTSRWYHITAGQHFCNECFDYFYRLTKPGHEVFMKWSALWEQEAGERMCPGPKVFLTDQYLPVWVQCTAPECRKWRKLPPAIDLHHVRQDIVRCSSCSIPQDDVVMLVNQPDWINTVSYSPLLRYSILASLLSEYVPSGVGISPITVHSSKEDKAGSSVRYDPASLSVNPLHPFNHPQEGPRARAFTPDNMEPEEIEAFPEYYKTNSALSKNQCAKMELYCLMRNLVLALWFFNYKTYLSAEKCVQSLSLRGLVRLWCAQKIPVVLRYLTQTGYVNTGFMDKMPRPFPLAPPTRESVIIIGAGTAGLAAAYHLRNFGYHVQILEASGRIGGRVKDDFTLGPCVGLGAMFITGINNNPLTLLACQLGLGLQHTNEDRCELINEQGWRPDTEMDKKVEGHFNLALDKLAEWRKMWPGEDIALGEKLKELHQEILEEEGQVSAGQVGYSEMENRLLDFHYSNLEFACGAPLDKVSAFNWDHNDNFPQFSGCHALLPDGYMSVLSRLAEGFDTKLDTVVRHVQLVQREGEGTMAVKVTDTRRNEYISDRVIVTVPLAVLKANMVSFSPPLCPRKKKAIESIGAGLVEKVALLFPQPFWRNMVGNADFFGHIASSQEQRGMFGVFYDLSPKSHSDVIADLKPTLSVDGTDPPKPLITDTPSLPHCILVTTVSGDGLIPYDKMSDSEIVEKCVEVLRKMFPQENIPAPLGSKVSRWGSDPFAQMSYSYAAVGSSGDDYDAMAEDIEGCIFFAGEATNRQHPQTVTGAYLSGIREASKIIAKLS